MSEKKKQKLELGTILRNDKGDYIVLGNRRAKNEKYNYIVQVRILDSEGNVKAKLENPIVSISDPRTRPGITEEEAAKIPEFVRAKLLVSAE